ncbi:MAG: hypothetical protein JWR04_3032 [Rhodoglobus sp.]|nr:hypothetical protein [Rhodoglobus sp.]
MKPSRLRLALILVGIAGAGLALLSWTQTWFDLVLEGGQPLAVAGQAAAPALSALGLASLALLGALSIAGRGVRVALGILEAAIGVLLAVVAIGALVDPVAASASTITATTAVGGPESIAALVLSAAVTLWPAVGIVAGVLTALVGIAVLSTGHRWPGPTKKYEAVPADDTGTPVGAWDSLSDGSDPTR